MPAAVTIDLGLVRDEPEERGDPLRPSRGLLALLLALLVAVTSTGSAPLRPGGWRTGTLPLAATDDFAIAGDRMLIVAREGVVSAYRLPNLTMIWGVPVPAAPGHTVTRHGDLLLVGAADGIRRQTATVVLAAATGAVRWQRDGRVIPLDGTPMSLGVSDVRSVSAPERRIEGTLTGLDATGRTSWTVPVPSTAVVRPLPDGRFLLVHDSGVAEVRSARDGAVLVAGEFPRAGYEPDNPRVIGGIIVLRHPGENTTRISGYELGTLRRLWTRPIGGLQNVDDCAGLICLGTTIGVRAVDPVSGANTWVSQSWRRAFSWGGMTVAYGRPTGLDADLAIVEPLNGGSLLDLSTWQLVGSVTDDVVLTHPNAVRGDTLVATVDFDRRSVRVLGAIPAGAGGCRAGEGVLACRQGSGSLAVWALA